MLQIQSLNCRMAMGSNVAFALRSIMKKNLPKDFKVNAHECFFFYLINQNIFFLLMLPFHKTSVSEVEICFILNIFLSILVLVFFRLHLSVLVPNKFRCSKRARYDNSSFFSSYSTFCFLF